MFILNNVDILFKVNKLLIISYAVLKPKFGLCVNKLYMIIFTFDTERNKIISNSIKMYFELEC